MNHEQVIEGNAFVHNTFQQCCIGIDDGKITAIKKILTGDEHLRFSKELILPAAIDVHVHFRDPGFPWKEDFNSGSVAAAFGGISSVFDMPNTRPATLSKQDLIEKRKNAERKSIVDFGLYAGLTKNSLQKKEHIQQLKNECHGFKLFLGETTNSLTLPIDLLSQAFSKIKSVHKPVLIHAEDDICLQKNHRVESSLVDHHAARPPHCETQAITQVISAAKSVGTPVHICHVSSAEAITQLEKKPDFVTYGITPHHSLLHFEMKSELPTHLKVNPPLRARINQEKLLQTIQQGNVFLLESDHAPHSEKEKDALFDEAPSGIPGVETMYPLYLAHAIKENLSFQRVISLLCEHPSELLQVSKGRILPDFDADLVVIDKRNMQKIRSERLHSKAGWTPFEGFSAVFPSHVFIRGTSVINDYEQQVSAGNGRMIPLTEI